MNKVMILPLLGMLCGCVAYPAGPRVRVMPAPGKPFDTFRAEDATCRHWAEQQAGMPAQQEADNKTATGAVAGTAVGAGLGAAFGSASGHAGAGALIGAASGLLVGTAVGSDAARVSSSEAQRRYDNAYLQCMYSYGNQVGGYRRVAAPAPPPPAVGPAPGPEGYPQPSVVDLEEAPQFIYSPDVNMYLAVGVPYDLVYDGTAYYYFYRGRWYRSAYYNGPWLFVPRRAYPPVFLRHRINNIRHYRDLEFRRYDHDRAHYDGRFHRPAFRGERHREHR